MGSTVENSMKGKVRFQLDKWDGATAGSWRSWRIQVKQVIRAEGLLHLIDGGAERAPSITDAQLKAQSATLFGLLVLYTPVGTDGFSILEDYEDLGKEAWAALEAHFVRTTPGRKMELLSELYGISKQSDKSVQSFLQRARSIVRELRSLGTTVPDELVIHAIAKGLGESYRSVAAIELARPEVTMESFVRVITEYANRTESGGFTGETSGLAKKEEVMALRPMPSDGVCRYWETGQSCPFGDSCKFKHSKNETPDEPRRPGFQPRFPWRGGPKGKGKGRRADQRAVVASIVDSLQQLLGDDEEWENEEQETNNEPVLMIHTQEDREGDADSQGSEDLYDAVSLGAQVACPWCQVLMHAEQPIDVDEPITVSTAREFYCSLCGYSKHIHISEEATQVDEEDEDFVSEEDEDFVACSVRLMNEGVFEHRENENEANLHVPDEANLHLQYDADGRIWVDDRSWDDSVDLDEKLDGELAPAVFELPRGSSGENVEIKVISVDVAQVAAENVAPTIGTAGTRKVRFLVDSGCGAHICRYDDLMHEKQVGPVVRLSLADGKTHEVVLRGTIKAVGVVAFEIQDVLLWPGGTHSFLSVQRLAENGHEVHFGLPSSFIQLCGGRQLPLRLEGRQYFLEFEALVTNKISNTVHCNFVNEDMKVLWHRRLAHFGPIREIGFDDEEVRGLLELKCEDCARGKARRREIFRKLGMTVSGQKRQRPAQQNARGAQQKIEFNDVVAVDTMGTIKSSFGGARFILVMVDKATGWGEICCCCSKEPGAIVVGVQAWIDKHGKMKRIFSDNGREFLGDFNTFTRDKDISRRFSPTYRPEFNGMAERRNGCLVNTSITMIIAAGLPVQLWPYAVKCACHVYNLVRSPFAHRTGEAPPLNYLRVFGCVCFVTIPTVVREHKFAPKAQRGVFLGYDGLSPSYVVMSLEENNFAKIIRSRDVKFFEDQKINQTDMDRLFLKFKVRPTSELEVDIAFDPEETEEEDAIPDDVAHYDIAVDDTPEQEPRTRRRTELELLMESTEWFDGGHWEKRVADADEGVGAGGDVAVPVPVDDEHAVPVPVDDEHKDDDSGDSILGEYWKGRHVATPHGINNVFEVALKPVTNKMLISADDYRRSALHAACFGEAKAVATPIAVGAQWDGLDESQEEELTDEEKHVFYKLMGICRYLTNVLHVELDYALSSLARHQSQPKKVHLVAAKRFLRYLGGCQGLSLRYEVKVQLQHELKIHVRVFTDSDWAGHGDRKSTSGGCILVQDCLVSWWSRRQTCVALSSTEAELAAMSFAAKKGKEITNLLLELMPEAEVTEEIIGDNTGALAIANGGGLRNVRHVDMQNLYVRQRVAEGLWVSRCGSVDNLADLMTKRMEAPRMTVLMGALGLERYAGEGLEVNAVYTPLRTALESDDSKLWLEAINVEIDALINKYKVMKWVPLKEKMHQVLPSLCLLSRKRDGRRKCRIVVCGNFENYSPDDIYAGVVSLVDWRCVMVIALMLDLYAVVVDVRTAFLQGESDDPPVRVRPARGLATALGRAEGDVWHVTGNLYGRRKSPRNWSKTFTRWIESEGLKPLTYDPSIFVKRNPIIIVMVYVDDIVTVGQKVEVNLFVRKLRKRFDTTEPEELHQYLGLEIATTLKTI